MPSRNIKCRKDPRNVNEGCCGTEGEDRGGDRGGDRGEGAAYPRQQLTIDYWPQDTSTNLEKRKTKKKKR